MRFPTSDPNTLRFLKMEGLGNDFIIVRDLPGRFEHPAALARLICDRRHGIGADGLVLVQFVERGARLSIFNADGSSAANCGNALRCVARLRWLMDADASGPPRELDLSIRGGVEALATPRVMGNDLWPMIRLGPPDFSPKMIPVLLPEPAEEPVLNYPWQHGAETLRLSFVGLGNPHCVVLCDGNLKRRLERHGSALETAEIFPDRANVEFVKVLDRKHIELVVWERGVGPTLACGTGACAAAAVTQLLGLVERTVSVSLPGGTVEVTWLGPGMPIFLAGPARLVFSGEMALPAELSLLTAAAEKVQGGR